MLNLDSISFTFVSGYHNNKIQFPPSPHNSVGAGDDRELLALLWDVAIATKTVRCCRICKPKSDIIMDLQGQCLFGVVVQSHAHVICCE